MSDGSVTPIAIVGIGCRFSGGANDPQKLWSLLAEGRSAWSEVPEERFKWESFYHANADVNGTLNHRGGHFLDQDIRAFDAEFFGISPIEAQAIDPQHRVQLETAYEALENAGIPMKDARGSHTSVYVAVFSRDYDHIQYSDPSQFAQYTMLGVGDAIASNRISYVFDLKGPSMTIDTGCSGSLVALHQACQSLRSNESEMALVGGTNLILSPDVMIPMSLLHILNPDGKCYSFDERGAGYGRGEGVATLVLKRLDDALAAGDPIRGVIRNSQINQDGKTQGITLPSQEAQRKLIGSVYHAAGLRPEDIGYLETHGTGTVAGDRTELDAIKTIFAQSRPRNMPLFLGSIKANIGHCEGSSGIAGLIKAILVLENGYIPPNIHLHTLKRVLEYDSDIIDIPTKFVKWPRATGGIRRASINSFGYGGTNAHVVIEEAPNHCKRDDADMYCDRFMYTPHLNGIMSKDEATYAGKNANDYDGSNLGTTIGRLSVTGNRKQLLVISAHSRVSLDLYVERILQWASSSEQEHTCIDDLAYTLASRRSLMDWRCNVVTSSCKDLAESLTAKPPSYVKASGEGQVIFIFTGQGSQWFAMGRELIHTAPAFVESLRKSDKLLTILGANWSLLEELQKDEKGSRVNESQVAQPGITALQIALVDLLDYFDVHPKTVVGHSSGEIGAAYAAGILQHAEALKVAYHRGFVSKLAAQSVASKGAMLSVGLGETAAMSHVAKLREGLVSVACVNSPSNVTISGDETAINELKQQLDSLSIFNRKLLVDTAYHSHHMRAISERYTRLLNSLAWKEPRQNIQFVSSVTVGEKRTEFGPSYWTNNLVSTVRFSQALEYVCRTLNTPSASACHHAFIEIGPHSALSGPVRETIVALQLTSFRYSYKCTLVRKQNAISTILELSGELFDHGLRVNLEHVNDYGWPISKRKVIHDLPPYAWNHSTKFWHESSLSRDRRLRPHPWHDLLGVRLPTSSIHEPIWRNLVSLNDLPWLRDHSVDGLIVFPGAGYLCAAIEAIRQISFDRGVSLPIRRYLLRDIHFAKALVIPESPAKVEIHLSLRPTQSSVNGNNSQWECFQIDCRAADGNWQHHCHGSIKVELQRPLDEVELDRQENQALAEARDRLARTEVVCSKELEMKTLYSNLQENGNHYGSNFSIVSKLRMEESTVTTHHMQQKSAIMSVMNPKSSVSSAVAVIEVPRIADCMPSSYMQPHVLHPATLDSLFHVNIPLFHERCDKGPVIPVSIEQIEISAQVPNKPGSQLCLAPELTPLDMRSAQMSVTAYSSFSTSKPEPVISMSNCELRGIGETHSVAESNNRPSNIIYQLVWRSEVDSLTPYDIRRATDDPKVGNKLFSPEERNEILNRAASQYVQECLKEFTMANARCSEKHYEYLLAWMEKYSRSSECQMYLESDGSVPNLRSIGAQGEMLWRIGQRLPSILSGEIDPLSLMLEDGLLYRIYAEDSSLQSCTHLIAWIKSCIFEKPSMTVLEIGAGTGGTTTSLFQALGDGGSPPFKRYDFTDISAGFFEPAKALLRSDIVKFKKLDIEQDPLSQGFEAHSYDLIIASNVIHATSPLDKALSHVRKLLKPTGRLAMIEATKLPPYANIIFGLLSGWWKRYSEGGTDGPMLSAKEWSFILQNNGFSGTDLVVKDYETSAHKCSLLISRFVEVPLQSTSKKICVVPFGSSSVYQGLSAVFESLGYTCRLASPSNNILGDDVYILIDAGHRPILEDPSQEDFSSIVSLFTKAKRVLWVSISSSESSRAEKGLIIGIARVARAENAELSLVTLDIEKDPKSTDSDVPGVILDVLRKSFQSPTSSMELEYHWMEGKLKIPRLVPDPKLELMVLSPTTQQPVSAPFNEITRPIKLHVVKPGLLDSMIFSDDEAVIELAPDEIEIEVKAIGINFKDVYIALGQMRRQTMTGEGAGVITRVGSSLQAQFAIGDRICGWLGTSFATLSRFRDTNVHRIPEGMSFETAASIPVAYMTAWYSLVEVSKLSAGDKVLIHAASGGVGQAAIQIARTFQAEIFATVGSASKRDLIKEKYNIPDSHIFSSRSGTFKSGIMRLTKGEGVNIILNSLSGDSLQDTWDCIARFGTFIEIGKTDIYQNGQISMNPFDRNVTFSSVDLVLLANHRSQVMKTVFSEVMQMFQDGRLQPMNPITVMPIGKIEETFRMIQARKHMGKLILKADSMVQALPPKREPLQLDAEGTYIIAGGQGSLGTSIAQYMVDHGAGNIVVLSRRGLGLNDATHNTSIRAMTCDITNAMELQKIITSISRDLPPIKGVIQAAMVLQDGILEQMSLEAYRTALCPKMVGTRNLVNALSNINFDFFIMLSSTCSILGHSGQANYAAGCAYQDALAQSQEYDNAHYMSLNLGMVEETDIIALHPEIRQALVRAGCLSIKVDDVLRLLEYSMSSQARKDNCRQVTIGFNRESISRPTSTSVLSHPLFSHLPTKCEAQEISSSTQASLNIEDALDAAKTVDEAQNVIASAVSKRMLALISLGDEEIPIDRPISGLGLDSLIAIELKNWIVQTFHSPLQTSEILDARDIKALSGIIGLRSTLLTSKNEKTASSDEIRSPSHQGKVSKPGRLPTIPLPELSDSLDQYVESVRGFCNPEDLQTLLAVADHYKSPDGPGPELHNRLVTRTKDPALDDWLYDLYQIDTWTKRRWPLNPWGHFFGAYPNGEIKHSQAKRAAVITDAAFRFKQRLEAGDVNRDYMNEQPLDMNLHPWTFNSYLQAGVGTDIIRKTAQNDYIVVLRNGHIFKVDIATKSSPDYLEAEFEAILDASAHFVPSAATLTADSRERWVQVRQELANVDTKNQCLIEMIEAAAFLVCFDDASPSTSTERVNQFLLSGPSNRWSDKSLQFVICSNSVCATVAEHAMLDGDTLNQLYFVVREAIQNSSPSCSSTADVTNGISHITVQPAIPEEHSFTLTPSLLSHISRLESTFHKEITPYEYTHHTFSSFGSTFLRSHKLAPKTTFQIIIQLASRLYFGVQHPCLEAVSMRAFHKGRLDFIQTTIPAVYDFCAAAATTLESDSSSTYPMPSSGADEQQPQAQVPDNTSLRSKLLTAVKSLTSLTTSTARGHGFRNHFLAMRQVLRADEDLPEFFKHPSFDLIGPGKISTDCIQWQGLVTEAGFHRPGEGKVWVHYEVTEGGCQMAVKAPPGKTEMFFGEVQRAAALVGALLEGRSTP